LQTSFLDTDPSLQSSGTSTLAKSSGSEAETDGSLTCECGKETFGCSIHPSTPDEWVASMQDFLAKICQSLESKRVLVKEPDQGFTEKSCVSLAWLDRNTCSWKTSQQSFLTDWEPFSETWPRWGMTQGIYAYAHPMSERRITEIDGSYLPTPMATDGTAGGVIGENDQYLPTKNGTIRKHSQTGSNGSLGLGRYVQFFPTPDTRGFVNEGSLQMLAKVCSSREEYSAMAYRAAASKKAKFWPTPTAHLAKEHNSPSEANRSTPSISPMIGGKLSPVWTEWLMGFPIGFTDSKDWVTRKSQSRPQQRGDCLGAAK
jgi:hypothetical protein